MGPTKDLTNWRKLAAYSRGLVGITFTFSWHPEMFHILSIFKYTYVVSSSLASIKLAECDPQRPLTNQLKHSRRWNIRQYWIRPQRAPPHRATLITEKRRDIQRRGAEGHAKVEVPRIAGKSFREDRKKFCSANKTAKGSLSLRHEAMEWRPYLT